MNTKKLIGGLMILSAAAFVVGLMTSVIGAPGALLIIGSTMLLSGLIIGGLELWFNN
jgi:hypothetical protein